MRKCVGHPLELFEVGPLEDMLMIPGPVEKRWNDSLTVSGPSHGLCMEAKVKKNNNNKVLFFYLLQKYR